MFPNFPLMAFSSTIGPLCAANTFPMAARVKTVAASFTRSPILPNDLGSGLWRPSAGGRFAGVLAVQMAPRLPLADLNWLSLPSRASAVNYNPRLDATAIRPMADRRAQGPPGGRPAP